ncbi:MFS transporter [Pelagibacteraceae bacterium]|nr:MFS transporter [Pelagibacteraceae bacterium]
MGKNYKTYFILFLCALIIGIKLGTLIPLLSLILESQGYSNTQIGINLIAQPIATILFVRVTPVIIHKYGLSRSIIMAQFITITLYFTFIIFDGLTAWFIIRFLIGLAGALAWNAFDTWMLSMADNTNRGKIITIYNLVFVGGFALGPVILSYTGIEGWLPFIVIASLSFCATIPLLTLNIETPQLPKHSAMPVFLSIVAAPTIFGAAILVGLEDVMFVSFLPIFLTQNNFSQEEALQYITIAIVGGIIFQPLVGYLIDKYNKRLILNVLVVFTFISPILMSLNLHNSYISILFLIIWGGASSSIFICALTMLGERYSASELAGATAILVMVFECGPVIGAVVVGIVMDLVGPYGFIYTISSFTFIFLIIAIYRSIWR